MANDNNHSNLNQQNNGSGSTYQNDSIHENKSSISNKYKNVEPLPESFRPRRDGPGGEDGE